MHTGWICPVHGGVAPSEKVCPTCDAERRLATPPGEVQPASPPFVPAPYPAPGWPIVPLAPAPPWWPGTIPGDGWTLTLPAEREPCAFDGLPPGIYGLVCMCPKCSPRCDLAGTENMIAPERPHPVITSHTGWRA